MTSNAVTTGRYFLSGVEIIRDRLPTVRSTGSVPSQKRNITAAPNSGDAVPAATATYEYNQPQGNSVEVSPRESGKISSEWELL